jgi:hypothetical protein
VTVTGTKRKVTGAWTACRTGKLRGGARVPSGRARISSGRPSSVSEWCQNAHALVSGGLPRFDYSAYLSRFVRADERTRTADLPSLRVIGQALQGCAGNCKCRIFRGVSFPCFAPCCTALRSRYQSGIRTSDSYNLTAGPMAHTRDLWSHYPPTPVAEGCGGCRTGVFKPISLLAVARRFCVLCAQWCQCRIFAG